MAGGTGRLSQARNIPSLLAVESSAYAHGRQRMSPLQTHPGLRVGLRTPTTPRARSPARDEPTSRQAIWEEAAWGCADRRVRASRHVRLTRNCWRRQPSCECRSLMFGKEASSPRTHINWSTEGGGGEPSDEASEVLRQRR